MNTRKNASPRSSAAGSTRKQLKEVTQAVLEELDEQAQDTLRPEKQLEEKRQQEVVAVADSLTTDSQGLAEIGHLKLSLSKVLTQLSEQLDSELQKYQAVQKAVTVKEQELREVYDIERRANTLAALIEADNRQRAEFEVEMAGRRDTQEQEIAALRERWQKEKAEYEQALKAAKDAEKRTRDREKEEFEYNFQREQTVARNKFADESAALEKEIHERREKLEKELVEREREVAARETELRELRIKVEALTKDRDTAVTQAVAAVREKLTTDAKAQTDLAQKQFEGERNVLSTRIEGMEKTVKDQAAQLAKISSQLETAYGKVQDIAVKAIEGSANVKAFQGLQSMLADATRKPAAEK